MTNYQIPTRAEELRRALARLTGDNEYKWIKMKKERLQDQFIAIMDSKQDHVEEFYRRHSIL